MYKKYTEAELAEVLANPNKKCTKCNTIKPKIDFYRAAAAKDGYGAQCKVCSKARVAAFHVENPDARRREGLWRLYGITLEEYDDILVKQGGGCAICGKAQGVDKKSLAVDHVHAGVRAGLIRGILCHRCNKWLVGKHTNGELLKLAGEYIETANTGRYVPEKYIKGPKRRRKTRKVKE